MQRLNVQYGAGWEAPPDWLNFDSSPSLWLERLPVIGRFLRVNDARFPEAIRFGDIVRGLPLPPGSAKAVYASHVLEHLALEDARAALRNTYALLEPGGVFRLIVPDLVGRARRYLERVEAGDGEAAHKFMREAFLGRVSRPRSLPGMIRSALGNSDHLWMWDELSMRAALAEAGFVDVRRCALADASDPAFASVEKANRFVDEDTSDVEVALEARKPRA